MSLQDLWQNIEADQNDDGDNADENRRVRRRLQTEAARTAAAVSRAVQKSQAQAVLPAHAEETFSARLQREFLTSAGYAHARKHEYSGVDSRHSHARERGRCIKSFLEAMGRTIARLFLGEGGNGADRDTEVSHVVNNIISDDTSTRLRSHRHDKCDVFTIMNTSQSLFFRYGSGCFESLSLPTSLQVLPSGKAGHIHAAFRAWLAVNASGIGARLLSLNCVPPEVAACPKHRTLILMGDALKANDAAWRLERALMSSERAKATSSTAPCHRVYGLRMRCANHQISLVRKPLILSFQQFWPTLVRLAHLFETPSDDRLRPRSSRSAATTLAPTFSDSEPAVMLQGYGGPGIVNCRPLIGKTMAQGSCSMRVNLGSAQMKLVGFAMLSLSMYLFMEVFQIQLCQCQCLCKYKNGIRYRLRHRHRLYRYRYRDSSVYSKPSSWPVVQQFSSFEGMGP